MAVKDVEAQGGPVSEAVKVRLSCRSDWNRIKSPMTQSQTSIFETVSTYNEEIIGLNHGLLPRLKCPVSLFPLFYGKHSVHSVFDFLF